MGYDFVWNELPAPAADARDAYEEWLYTGGPTREVSDRYHEAVMPYTFHLNIAGMAYCRQVMASFGMTYEAEAKPFPSWPEYDRSLYGTDWADAAREWRRSNSEEYERVLELEREAMRQGDAARAGIPMFKFTSNGPWLVTEAEVRSALALYDDADEAARVEAELVETWAAWIEYVREAAAHGGFEVT